MFQSQDLQRKISLFTIFSFLFYTFINVLLLSLPYFQLDLDTQIFSETLRNWSSYPILDLTISSTCPDGYQPLTTRYWPGMSSGCWCNSANPTIHSNSCTSTELSSGCLDIPSQPSKPLNAWGSKGGKSVQICLKRSSKTWTEVSEVSIKTCPIGYKKCGASWENIYCTKEAICPITKIQVLPMTATDQTKCLASPLLCVVLDDSATNPRMIQFRRGDSFDGMPIVDMRINEYSMCNKLSQDNITPKRLQFPLLNMKEEYCSENSKEDVRWEKVDEMTEKALFALNGLTTEINSLSGFTSSGMAGYYQTGKTGDDYKWGVFTRPYFPWKTDCREDLSKILKKINNMDQIKTTQMLVMVFGIAGGFLFGVVMTYIEIQQMRGKKIFFVNIAWGNEKGVKRFWLVKDLMAGFFGILQIPVQVWSLVVVGTTRSLFLSAYKRNCAGNFAEDLKNFAFEKLTQCFACTVISLAMTGVLLAIYCGLARRRNQGLKGGNGSVRVVPVESGEMSVSYVNNDRSELVLITGNSQGVQAGRRGVVDVRENGGVEMRRRIR